MNIHSGDAPVVVTVPGGCRCPGTPHAEDQVRFRKYLSSQGGARAMARLRAHVREHPDDDLQEAMEGLLGPLFVETEVISWDLQGPDGKTLPIDRRTIENLDWGTVGYYLTDIATTLYGDEVAAPLVRKVSESSQSSQTNGSTSPHTASTPKPRKRSTSSSPTTSAGTGQ